jgi:hypothetical protein
MKLTESNWNNDLAVTHDRIIDPNDQDIVGFVKTKPTGEFAQIPAQTNPLTPTTPKMQVAQAPAPMDRQELPEDQQPVKADDLRVGNSNAKRLQQAIKIDSKNLESIVKSQPANSLDEQLQSLQNFAQPKPTPQPSQALIKPFAQNNAQPQKMSMAPKPLTSPSPIRKPPQMSQPAKQFKAPQMSMAPKPQMSMAPKPTPRPKPQQQSRSVAQNKRKPFFKSVAKKVKGWFA